MNILYIGDPSGNDDEGMKKIGKKLSATFNDTHKDTAQFISVLDVLLNYRLLEQSDIIHYIVGPSWRSLIYVWIILKFQYRANFRVIISFIHPNWSPLSNLIFKFSKPDAAVVQSMYWKDFCIRAGLRVHDRTISGVDLIKFKPISDNQKNILRRKLDLPHNKKIVLHVGHLNEGRNLHHITNLVSEYVQPIVIGSTTVKPDINLINFLESSGVIVINKYLANIEQYYQAADCYIFPTINPQYCIQIPLSVIEALACDLPVVSTKFEGLPFFVQETNHNIIYLDNLKMIPTVVNDVLSSGKMMKPSNLMSFNWFSIRNELRLFYTELLKNNDR